MKGLSLIVALAWTGTHCRTAQTARAPTATEIVTRLYARFACEAVSVAGCGQHAEFTDQPRPVLARYFDEELVRLWFADRRCRHDAQVGDICGFEKLDFSPIWSSQDPVGTTFIVRPTAQPNVVEVELHTREGDRVVLRYSLITTEAGWRIHDISNGTLWSLLAKLTKGD